MQAIRNMESAWEKIAQSKFGLSTYKDATGRTLPCYILTKTECLYITTKFNDEARAFFYLIFCVKYEEMSKKFGCLKKMTYLRNQNLYAPVNFWKRTI